jgi:hypothetical protein
MFTKPATADPDGSVPKTTLATPNSDVTVLPLQTVTTPDCIGEADLSRGELRRMKGLEALGIPRPHLASAGRLSLTYFDPGCCPANRSRQDNRADVDDDGAMRLLVVLACLAGIIGLAVPAQADPSTDPGVDASFLDSLKRANITYRDGPAAIGAAKFACDLMDQGQPEFDVIKRVAELNPGFGLSGATKFTALASSAYCPQYLSESSVKTTSPFPGPFPGLPSRG